MKLAVNRETQQAIAVKIIDLEKAADCYDNVRKEVCSEMIVRWSLDRMCTITLLLFTDLYSSNASGCSCNSILWTKN